MNSGATVMNAGDVNLTDKTMSQLSSDGPEAFNQAVSRRVTTKQQTVATPYGKSSLSLRSVAIASGTGSVSQQQHTLTIKDQRQSSTKKHFFTNQ